MPNCPGVAGSNEFGICEKCLWEMNFYYPNYKNKLY